jgi:hypothetical protein
MNDLEAILGKALTVSSLAEYLGVNEKIIRQNYRQFGGIKIGRHYRFFTREVAKYALEKRQKQIYSASQEERTAQGTSVSVVEGRESVGEPNAADVRPGMERNDRHGLLD